jgi:hypothetical protein
MVDAKKMKYFALLLAAAAAVDACTRFVLVPLLGFNLTTPARHIK